MTIKIEELPDDYVVGPAKDGATPGNASNTIVKQIGDGNCFYYAILCGLFSHLKSSTLLDELRSIDISDDVVIGAGVSDDPTRLLFARFLRKLIKKIKPVDVDGNPIDINDNNWVDYFQDFLNSTTLFNSVMQASGPMRQCTVDLMEVVYQKSHDGSMIREQLVDENVSALCSDQRHAGSFGTNEFAMALSKVGIAVDVEALQNNDVYQCYEPQDFGRALVKMTLRLNGQHYELDGDVRNQKEIEAYNQAVDRCLYSNEHQGELINSCEVKDHQSALDNSCNAISNKLSNFSDSDIKQMISEDNAAADVNGELTAIFQLFKCGRRGFDPDQPRTADELLAARLQAEEIEDFFKRKEFSSLAPK